MLPHTCGYPYSMKECWLKGWVTYSVYLNSWEIYPGLRDMFSELWTKVLVSIKCGAPGGCTSLWWVPFNEESIYSIDGTQESF